MKARTVEQRRVVAEKASELVTCVGEFGRYFTHRTEEQQKQVQKEWMSREELLPRMDQTMRELARVLEQLDKLTDTAKVHLKHVPFILKSHKTSHKVSLVEPGTVITLITPPKSPQDRSTGD